MKFVFILVVILSVSIQENAGKTEEFETRIFSLNLPSVESIRSGIQEALDNFEAEFQKTLKRTENMNLKYLHDWLSNENYHFRVALRRAQETNPGASEKCTEEVAKMFKLFETEYEKGVKYIQSLHTKYSARTICNQIIKDTPKGYNLFEWIWYVIKLPVSAFQAFLDASKAVREMQEDASKYSDTEMQEIRKQTDEFLTKVFYPCLEKDKETATPEFKTVKKRTIEDFELQFPIF